MRGLGETASPRRSVCLAEGPWEGPARAGESPVGEGLSVCLCSYLSTAGHEESRGKLGRPRSKAKYSWRPIADQYREGKVKSTPVRGMKENLKPYAYKQSEARAGS